MHALAVDRQTHDHARAFADTAADIDVAAMQFHQAFDNGETEPGAFVPPLVASSGLEEGLADARQIHLRNADPGICHFEHDERAFTGRFDIDAAATLGKFDGVGEQVQQDLIHRALIGEYFGHVRLDLPLQRNAGLDSPSTPSGRSSWQRPAPAQRCRG